VDATQSAHCFRALPLGEVDLHGAQSQVLALHGLSSLGQFLKLPKGKAEVVRPLILDRTHNCQATIAKK
jgi:hypothetical protein